MAAGAAVDGVSAAAVPDTGSDVSASNLRLVADIAVARSPPPVSYAPDGGVQA